MLGLLIRVKMAMHVPTPPGFAQMLKEGAKVRLYLQISYWQVITYYACM